MTTNYFSDDELKCRCCGELVFDDDFRQTLNAIREDFARPMVISSGYRCTNHPVEARKIASGGNAGTHSLGVAVDVAVSYSDSYDLIQVALRHGIKRIGVNQKGTGRFIHLDVSTKHPSPTVWSY